MRELTSNIVRDLDAFYKDRGIAAEAFHCTHQSTCRAVCSGAFVSAKEAFVGSYYERAVLPRILFVSLDPARDDSVGNAESRSMRAVRQREESYDPKVRRAHWYQTKEFAFRMLQAAAQRSEIPDFDRSNVQRFFAHTNSAKCKDPTRGTRQGRATLFHNCREHVRAEVPVLRPDILVLQGRFAQQALSGCFEVSEKHVCPGNPRYAVEVVRIQDRQVLKYSMTHPTARYGLYQREVSDAWGFYIDEGHAFIDRWSPR